MLLTDGEPKAAAERGADFARGDAMIDPELADALVGVRERVKPSSARS